PGLKEQLTEHLRRLEIPWLALEEPAQGRDALFRPAAPTGFQGVHHSGILPGHVPSLPGRRGQRPRPTPRRASRILARARSRSRWIRSVSSRRRVGSASVGVRADASFSSASASLAFSVSTGNALAARMVSRLLTICTK